MDRFQRQNTEQLQIARAQEQQTRARNIARRYANTDVIMWGPNDNENRTEMMCGICLDEYQDKAGDKDHDDFAYYILVERYGTTDKDMDTQVST